MADISHPTSAAVAPGASNGGSIMPPRTRSPSRQTRKNPESFTSSFAGMTACPLPSAIALLLELLQEPVDVIQLLTRPGAVGTTPAQFLFDGFGPMWRGLVGNGHVALIHLLPARANLPA